MIKYLPNILAIAMLATPPAFAQSVEPPPAQAAKSAAWARADAYLKAAGATDLFENVSEGDLARVKHKASGLICGFDDTPTARVTVFLNAVRGNDVGCVSKIADVLISLYATKLPPEANLETEFRGTLGVMKTIYPDIKGYSGTLASMSSEAAPKDQTAFFVVNDKDGRITGKPGTEVVSRLSMAIVKDGWVLKIRASTPNTDDQSGMNLSVVSGVIWMGTLMDFAPQKSAEKAVTPAGSPPNP